MWIYLVLGIIAGAFIYQKFFAFNHNYKQIMQQGAKIIDVRTVQEFSVANIPGSINIPLGELQGRINEVKNLHSPIITCCASGVRSASANTILKKEGITCYNGGGYAGLQNKLK